MENLKQPIVKLAAVACFAGCGAIASADTVTMRYVTNTGLNNINLAGGSDHNGNQSAGHLTYQVQGGNSFNTFCIELGEFTSGSNLDYEIVDLSQAPNPGDPGMYGSAVANKVVAVIAKAIDNGWIDINLQATPGAIDNETNADRMSAIQGAIWAQLFGATATSSDSDVSDRLGELDLTNLRQDTSTFYLMQNRLRAAVNDGAQDQLYVVPLPTSVWAGLGMLGGLAGIRIARRR
ncbi:MAG: hypothetical protein ACF8MF_12715 [Phycisphaerales bacterium JB052]